MASDIAEDFERRRQARETTHESVVSLIVCGASLTMLLTQTLRDNLGNPASDILAPVQVRVVTGLILLSHLVLLAYLRRKPRYDPRRKYLLVVARILLLGCLSWAEWSSSGPIFGLLAPGNAYMMLIILTGMTLSRRPVILAGVLACIVYPTMSMLGPTGFISVRASMIEVHGFVIATFVTAFIVHCMLQMHAESVSNERLSRFFAPEVAARIASEPDVRVRVDERTVTVLFCDISGFTTIASDLPPRQVVDLLNAYFPAMVDVIFRHGGTLEKFVGDAVLAVWGAPYGGPDDADRAVAAAIDMQRALAGLDPLLAAIVRAPLRLHIGLCSGPVAAGYIGTEQYIQYAVIGDTTNTASRVCAVAGPGEILLTESTRELIRRTDVAFDPLPAVSVKGKDEPLVLHRVRPCNGFFPSGSPTYVADGIRTRS